MRRGPPPPFPIAALVLAACSSIDTPSGGGQSPTADNRAAKNGGTLVVALSDEPDPLDPTTARTLVGRSVFMSICEKLYDINAKLEIVPQLAAVDAADLGRRQDRHDQAAHRASSSPTAPRWTPPR